MPLWTYLIPLMSHLWWIFLDETIRHSVYTIFCNLCDILVYRDSNDYFQSIQHPRSNSFNLKITFIKIMSCETKLHQYLLSTAELTYSFNVIAPQLSCALHRIFLFQILWHMFEHFFEINALWTGMIQNRLVDWDLDTFYSKSTRIAVVQYMRIPTIINSILWSNYSH